MPRLPASATRRRVCALWLAAPPVCRRAAPAFLARVSQSQTRRRPRRIQPRGRSDSIARCSRHSASRPRRGLLLGPQPVSPLSRRHAAAGSVRYRSAFSRAVASSAAQCSRPSATSAACNVSLQRQQVVHVVGGISELRRCERPARPVGSRLALVDRMTELSRHQFRVANLRWITRAVLRRPGCRRSGLAPSRRQATSLRGPACQRAGSSVCVALPAARTSGPGPVPRAGRSSNNPMRYASCTRHNCGR